MGLSVALIVLGALLIVVAFGNKQGALLDAVVGHSVKP